MSSLKVAAVCTLREAAEFKNQLVGLCDGTGDVEIDAGTVDKIDTACLQLLVGFVRRLATEGRKLTWSGTTPELHRAAMQLGLVDVLQLPAPEAQS